MAAAFCGPIVWLLEGPTPILYMSFMVFIVETIIEIKLQKYSIKDDYRKKLKNFRKNVWRNEKCCIFAAANEGALAQLARALAWHARGHRFDSVMLHKIITADVSAVIFIFSH